MAIPTRDAAEGIARSLRVLTDPTRVQLLGMVVDSPGGRALVGQLAASLGLSQPTVSHHMRVMVEEGLLEREQEGRVAWYSVAPDRQADVTEVLRARRGAQPIPLAPAVLERITDDLAVRFRGVFSVETIDRYVRESYALLAERARITRYLPSLTSRFAGERLSALATAENLVTDATPEVLFVCVQNAGRSQMASAILRSLAGNRVRVRTAGSEPAELVNPLVVNALDEVGIPIAGEYPKPLTDEVVRAADYVITMGCGDACPVYAGRRYLDWELADPVGLPLDGVRAVRDDITRRVRELLTEIEKSAAKVNGG
ncbi:metalloregulator ArsR/SmtB family transcription factor [Cryobacterium tagatosivorans]|uniref:Metalloregulator ArsR/SmtB family transcription factor n=1 Tax=Cryobacterium tagatosivorans TaxID=1259199 RepID=A0A4R8UFA2_9MICO|nr:metalloregulator ArsR/SmtB family transcription factor [Cryobacterium tagatosivorans]TFB52808.1 metalloregulator ArsR/SmtB family transcription factor [Cryobacterium tagatosivorans]